MAAEAEFDPGRGMWTIRLSGVVDSDDVVKVSRLIDGSPPGQRNAPRLWDARDAAGAATSHADLRALARTPEAVGAQGRVAVLVSRDVDFGISRMYGVYVDELAADFGVFRDYDEAVSWLSGGLPPSPTG